jgi:co-chaperonin GroES (HSP10)
MTPLNGYLIVLAVDKEEEARKEWEKSHSILLAPNSQILAERAIAEGTVLCSDDVKIKKDDDIIFSSFATLDFDYQGKTVYAIQAKDVIAIL